ncbi:hypothetical protein L211DRAFT_870054 [Terfezia boudieri ATCC MYA-4762]|uniref:HTH CENPB-type domain-containing protein n=1 Tax=Terfezia boudieri ATCC MYA-4762 TaxID=1051890 RepID=A0A3N4LTL7_9PEZI|nr:hypothetical protein L211DRAFT_870054 [Terfezia boudieri ATCC MYA-4762]
MGNKQAFSLREKYEICLEREKQVKEGKKMRLDEFGLLFPDRSGKGIPKSSLSDILAMSDEFLKNPPVDGAHKKKKRAPVYPIFEALLAEWIERAHAVRVPINDAIIQTQAHKLVEELSGQEECEEDYMDFQYSGGWLSAFKVCNGICGQKLQGEGGGMLESDIEVARIKLREDLRGYALRDIWDCDETALQ